MYCIPLNHTRVLRIDPVAKTTSLYGPALHNPGGAWTGGCAGLHGCVYGTPHKSGYVLRIDPFSGSVSRVGNYVPEEVRKLQGAVLGPHGNIWCLPWHGRAPMLCLYTQSSRRQWLRVLCAIDGKGYTIPAAVRSHRKVKQLLDFFRCRPGLRRLVGAKMSLFYSPSSAQLFSTRDK